jgi:hypothetical protein
VNGYLVATQAGDALGPNATDEERRSAGTTALEDIARKVRDSELELLDRLIRIAA